MLVWCCLNNLFLPCRGCAAPPSPRPSKYLKSEDKLRTFQNFNQISKCQCIADISKCKHLKGRFEGTCPFITLSLSGPEVGLLLRSFALKGNNDLIWAKTLPNYDQARKPRSPKTLWNYTLRPKDLTQFEAIIWAKHKPQWQSNKWKIVTLF